MKEVNEQTMSGAFQTVNSKQKALRLEFLKAGEPTCGGDGGGELEAKSSEIHGG